MSCFPWSSPSRGSGRVGDSDRVRSKSWFLSKSSSDRIGQSSYWEADDGSKERAYTEGYIKSEIPAHEKGDAVVYIPYHKLAAATKDFKPEYMIGEGGFGPVYKGKLESGQIVAIKQLNLEGLQGNQEFVVEVLMLSVLHHPNLVNLLGYCSHKDQKMLVYEYMRKGSLEDHLFDIEPQKEPLDWNTRIKIALGAARGIEYLHVKASPPVIYRDIKAANILLDDDFNPKLSDFGLAKLAPVGDRTHISTRVMGTPGYCAPEYASSGRLTLKSDVYSFGVVLLELISGRRSLDDSRPRNERDLVFWFWGLLKGRNRFSLLVDPLLERRYHSLCLHHAIQVIEKCLAKDASHRPLIGDVVKAFEYFASKPYTPESERTSKNPKSNSSSSFLH